MAHREINLITTKRVLTPEEQSIQKRLRFWMPLILGAFTLVFITIMGYSFYLNNRLANLDSSIKLERDSIAAKEKDEGLYTLLKQKISALTQIFGLRYAYSPVFDFLNNLATDGITIRSIQLLRSGNTVLIIRAADAFKLDTFVRNVLKEAEAHFNRVELVGVQFNPQGDYAITLNLSTNNSFIP